MSKWFLTNLPDGRLGITEIGPDPAGHILAKTMFELSRDGSDMTTHFEPKVHTLKKIAAGIPGHVPLMCRECDETDLPSEQKERGIRPTFRDAWEDTGTTIQINMDKARVIHMNRIRKARDAELENLDVSYMSALEIFDTNEQARIVALKQVLRDIPQIFDLNSYTEPAELKAAWPTELPRGN